VVEASVEAFDLAFVAENINHSIRFYGGLKSLKIMKQKCQNLEHILYMCPMR